MPLIRFTYAIQRHVACPNATVDATTVREALNAVFANNPAARSYVLDEHGDLRKHMVVFLNGEAVADRKGLSDPVAPDGEIDVFQALSGG